MEFKKINFPRFNLTCCSEDSYYFKENIVDFCEFCNLILCNKLRRDGNFLSQFPA